MTECLSTSMAPVRGLCPHGQEKAGCARCQPACEPDLCEHGYPEGRGCTECEFWERADYEFGRFWDR